MRCWRGINDRLKLIRIKHFIGHKTTQKLARLFFDSDPILTVAKNKTDGNYDPSFPFNPFPTFLKLNKADSIFSTISAAKTSDLH